MRVPERGVLEDSGPAHAREADPRLIRAWLAGLTVVLILLPAPSLSDLPPPIFVEVDGLARPIPKGATVGEIARRLRLRPRAGALLDVDGIPLRRRLYPGHLRLNGERAEPNDVLRAEDVLEVVDGRDHYEELNVVTRRVPGGQIENPQTHLGTTPGRQIITTGARSGKLVSSVFHPTGGADVPPAVALTFDDGPSPRFTVRIVRILLRLRVQATFFTVGSLVRRHPGIVRRVARAGMQLANHSLEHPYSPPFATLPRREIERQIAAGGRALEELGVEPAAFRPPGGSWSAEVLDLAESFGQRTVLWDVDSRDWTGLPARKIARNVLSSVTRGSIVLLHDGGGDRTATLRALPRIVRGIRAKGLGFSLL